MPSGPRTCWKSASGPEGSRGGGVGVGVGDSAVVVLGDGLQRGTGIRCRAAGVRCRSRRPPARRREARESVGAHRWDPRHRAKVVSNRTPKTHTSPRPRRSETLGEHGLRRPGGTAVRRAPSIADLVDEQRVSDADHQVDGPPRRCIRCLPPCTGRRTRRTRRRRPTPACAVRWRARGRSTPAVGAHSATAIARFAGRSVRCGASAYVSERALLSALVALAPGVRTRARPARPRPGRGPPSSVQAERPQIAISVNTTSPRSSPTWAASSAVPMPSPSGKPAGMLVTIVRMVGLGAGSTPRPPSPPLSAMTGVPMASAAARRRRRRRRARSLRRRRRSPRRRPRRAGAGS